LDNFWIPHLIPSFLTHFTSDYLGMRLILSE
jgi:hypothetical protein